MPSVRHFVHNPGMASLLLSLTLLASSHFSRERVSVFLLRCELSRFPSKAQCRYWDQEAEKHLRWIDVQARLFPHQREDWWAYRRDVEASLRAWNMLYILQTRPNNVHEWYSLNEIRTFIGEENYRRGFLYPPIAPCYLTAK